MNCRKCGTCCVAPDIKALGKGLGIRCLHLGSSNECRIYDERPAVCRGYQPDEICQMISAPELDDRVSNYLRLFNL